ncbi:MAG: YrhB domain-containing protein [Candidatus Acidiferrales bacterium]
MANQQSENITQSRALEIARKAIEDLKASQPLVILDNKTQSKDFGWVFFYTSKKFLETHDKKYLVPGNGPLVIDRSDGSPHFLSSSLPPNRAIEEYEKNWRKSHEKK